MSLEPGTTFGRDFRRGKAHLKGSIAVRILCEADLVDAATPLRAMFCGNNFRMGIHPLAMVPALASQLDNAIRVQPDDTLGIGIEARFNPNAVALDSFDD